VCRPSTASGSGTVTSVGLVGTANQITVTGASPITTSGSLTLSFPAGGVTLPGTTTGTFSGNLTGTASTATTATNATNAAITDDTTTNATMFPLWVPTASGNQALKVSSTLFTFNPSTSNFAVGSTPSATAGERFVVTDNFNGSTIARSSNPDSTDTGSIAILEAKSSGGTGRLSAHGGGRTATRAGVTLANWVELSGNAGNGLLVGTTSTFPLILYTNSIAALSVDASQNVTLPILTMTPPTMTATNSAVLSAVTHRYDWTNAMIAALGASTTGDITVCTLPAKVVVRNVYIVIDSPDTSANPLTIAVGVVSAAYIDFIVASDAKAAANTVYGDASAERGTNLTGYYLPSITGTTAVKAHFIKTTTNLSTVTASTGHIYIETETLP